MTLPILQERGGALSGLVEGLGLGAQQAMPAIGELILSAQKEKKRNQVLNSILGVGQPQGGENFQKTLGLFQQPTSSGFEVTPEKIMALEAAGFHDMANSAARIYQGQEKERIKKQKQTEESKIGQESFDEMARLLKKGNLGFGSEIKGKVFGGKTAEDVGEFNSLTGALESMLVDRVSRGTLSNARFKYITETLLPKATDRQATIKGKMKALARELGLDPNVLLSKSSGKAQKPQEKTADFVVMTDPQGIQRRIPRNQLEAAKAAGGILVE